MPDAKLLCRDLGRIRSQSPLVHNITNYVVMNVTANALLALGASPVMAHATEEVKEMVGISRALVVNIGTLSGPWIEGMKVAVRAAVQRGIPWILDPVGAGATRLRTSTAVALLSEGRPAIIRGNASETLALSGESGKTRGVDSAHGAEAALTAAQALAGKHGCVVTVSGATDIITDGRTVVRVSNGHPMMARVTGLGCVASALSGAFAAVNSNYLEAASHAMGVMGIAGEMGVEKSAGPGTLQLHFTDALYLLGDEDIHKRLKMQIM
jgi:hydroxyethylthiazole kinase